MRTPMPGKLNAICCVLVMVVLVGCGRVTSTAGGPSPERDEGLNSTGSVSSVTPEDVPLTMVSRVEEMLDGHVAGLRVVRLPSGEISLRIRGISSLSAGGGGALLVIDGVQVNSSLSTALGGLNPHDIKRIEVLKDAASLAMYGMRGANGVVRIQTKRAP